MADRGTDHRWPRGLSREQAASYVGVSATTFDQEVAQGLWPQGERRGKRGGRLVWDKKLLDRRWDRRNGLIRDEETESGIGDLEWGKSA